MNAGWLWIAAGGFGGAVCRYGLTVWFQRRLPSRLPLGTLTVNVLGAFLLGWMAGAGIGGTAALAAGVGFMGAFTTFSTLEWESLRLALGREWTVLAAYLALTLVLGLVAAWGGYELGSVGIF